MRDKIEKIPLLIELSLSIHEVIPNLIIFDDRIESIYQRRWLKCEWKKFRVCLLMAADKLWMAMTPSR